MGLGLEAAHHWPNKVARTVYGVIQADMQLEGRDWQAHLNSPMTVAANHVARGCETLGAYTA